MILSIHNNARITEVGEVAKAIVALYERTISPIKQEVFLQELIMQIKQQSDELTLAVNTVRVSSSLKNSDKKRNYAVKVLSKLLEAYDIFPDEHIQQSGKAVLKIFKGYGMKITRQSYVNKSTLIDSLLLDLKTPQIITHINNLSGVDAAIQNLEIAQTEFRKLTAHYHDQKALQSNKKSATVLRKPLLNLINKQLMVYLTAQVMVNNSVFDSFKQSIDKIINKANTSIKTRQARELQLRKKILSESTSLNTDTNTNKL